MSWGAVLQGGQPITLSCPSGTGNGTGCYDILIPGQDPQERHAHRLQRTAELPRRTRGHGPSPACGGQPVPTQLRSRDAFRSMAASACWGDPRPRSPDHRSSGWISPPSKTSSSANASTCSSGLSSSTFSTTRTSTLLIRRQRSSIDFGFGQFHQLELWRSGFDSRCSLRSEADPVCFEVEVLS